MVLLLFCSFAHLPRSNNDGNYDKAYHSNDSNDNNNDKLQATSNNLPVDTMQHCIANSKAGQWQHHRISTQLKQQQFWQGVMAAAGGGGGVSQWLRENAKKFNQRRT